MYDFYRNTHMMHIYNISASQKYKVDNIAFKVNKSLFTKYKHVYHFSWVQRLANKLFYEKMIFGNELVEMAPNKFHVSFDGTSPKNVISDFSY